ncbi:MAG TPA: glycosyltransferase family 2 protein [Ktedonobacterales bacterium]
MATIDISVVLPVFNEEGNIPRVHEELKAALTALGRTFEIIYVDDGSADASYKQLAQIAETDPTVIVLRFRRNFGQTAAITAGIDYSTGDIIIPMDADLQNDPADIGRMVAKIDEGYDVVSGWRKHRQDAFKRRLPSMVANGLISQVTGVHLHDYGCTLKAYRREVLVPVRLYGEMHRFIPVHAHWSGARIVEMPVNHRARQIGQSKYNLTRAFRVVLDLLTVKFLGSYSTKPLYAFGYVGMLMMAAAFLTEIIALIQRTVPPHVHLNNNPLTLLGAILLVLSIQVILMGLLAELIMRTYYESQAKPTYLIRSIINACNMMEPASKYRVHVLLPTSEASSSIT